MWSTPQDLQIASNRQVIVHNMLQYFVELAARKF